MLIELDPQQLGVALAALDRQLVLVVQRAVAQAVEAGAHTAFSTARFKDRTGKARRKTYGFIHRLTPRGADGRIVCDVPYASFLNEGTKAHRIEQVNALALRWVDHAGDTHFARAVWHPGTSADGFMARGRAMAEMVLKREIERGVSAAERAVNQ